MLSQSNMLQRMTGSAPWRLPIGRRDNAALVGIGDSGLPDTDFAVDRSDLWRLHLPSYAGDYSEASIAGTTLHMAQALSFDPPVLLADEPIAALDQQNAELVAQTVKAFALS